MTLPLIRKENEAAASHFLVYRGQNWRKGRQLKGRLTSTDQLYAIGCAIMNLVMGRVPIFPIKLPAEHGVKWPSVSTSSTDPLCSRTATGVWPRHWRDTKRDRALSSGD